MEPYEHTDEDGDVMTIADLDGKSGTALVRARHGAEVAAADLPVITGKLYDCGLPVPVILERQETTANGAHTPVGRVYPFRSAKGDRVAFNAVTGDRFLTPAEARQAAAVLAAYADDAEAREPDPAEVEELAEAIRADRATHDALPLPPAIDKLSARTALRWMNAKAARDDA